jgi:hypothetical protein
VDYYPEIPSGPQFKFLQSNKWLKCLAPEHHPQMCDVRGEHYYIFEPAQLESNRLVIPIFFYFFNSQLYSKCVSPIYEEYSHNNQRMVKIKIAKYIQFDDPNLLIINTNQFQNPYPQIQIHQQLLSEECGNELYGIYLI